MFASKPKRWNGWLVIVWWPLDLFRLRMTRRISLKKVGAALLRMAYAEVHKDAQGRKVWLPIKRSSGPSCLLKFGTDCGSIGSHKWSMMRLLALGVRRSASSNTHCASSRRATEGSPGCQLVVSRRDCMLKIVSSSKMYLKSKYCTGCEPHSSICHPGH